MAPKRKRRAARAPHREAGRPLSESDLLSIWETGRACHDVDKALVLLDGVLPDFGWDRLANLPVGQRDGLLLQIRDRLFGPEFAIGVLCPRCGERLEFTATVGEFLGEGWRCEEPPAIRVAAGGYEIAARPVSSRDLTALSPGQPPQAARGVLLQCVVISAQRAGQPIAPGDLPPEITAAVAAALADADPLADLEFQLSCPACSCRWILVFDIVQFLWRELSAVAQAVLDDVHDLATAYGWREADILAMPAARRAYYLTRVRA